MEALVFWLIATSCFHFGFEVEWLRAAAIAFGIALMAYQDLSVIREALAKLLEREIDNS